MTIVHNHTFIHLRGVCTDVPLDGAPHGHHAGEGAGESIWSHGIPQLWRHDMDWSNVHPPVQNLTQASCLAKSRGWLDLQYAPIAVKCLAVNNTGFILGLCV